MRACDTLIRGTQYLIEFFTPGATGDASARMARLAREVARPSVAGAVRELELSIVFPDTCVPRYPPQIPGPINGGLLRRRSQAIYQTKNSRFEKKYK
jgi:hypothetical protein